MKINLEAVIDFESKPVKIYVKPVTDLWQDLAYFLEVVSFLAKMNIGHDKRVETPEKMAEYIKQYLLKGMADYKDVTGEKEPDKV